MSDTATPPVIRMAPLGHFDGLDLPRYASPGAAGMDVQAACEDCVTIAPRQRISVPTGLGMAIPHGYEVQIRPRSGLARKFGVTVANAPGTIDSDYRGEVMVLLVNLGEEAFRIERGMRIAQLVVAPVSRPRIMQTVALDETERGAGGFGSTGV